MRLGTCLRILWRYHIISGNHKLIGNGRGDRPVAPTIVGDANFATESRDPFQNSHGMSQPKKTSIGLMVVIAILVPVAAVVVFAWLAEEVLKAGTEQFDALIRTTVHQLSSPTLTQIMKAFSFLGEASVLVAMSVLVIILLSFFHRAREAVLLAITMTGAVGLDVALKHAFHRPRPVSFFGASPHSYSFPSGHALASLCFYATMAAILSAQVRRRSARLCIWIAAALLVGMIGLSRVYLGVHYPSDVIAGYCAALFWVEAVSLLNRGTAKR